MVAFENVNRKFFIRGKQVDKLERVLIDLSTSYSQISVLATSTSVLVSFHFFYKVVIISVRNNQTECKKPPNQINKSIPLKERPQ